jgi:hypothetical protein
MRGILLSLGLLLDFIVDEPGVESKPINDWHNLVLYNNTLIAFYQGNECLKINIYRKIVIPKLLFFPFPTG